MCLRQVSEHCLHALEVSRLTLYLLAPMNSLPPRLNLLALPSRTMLLFSLILAVVFIPILATFFSPSPICAPCLLLGMIVLPLRYFLRNPEHTIAQQQLAAPTADDRLLCATVAELARNIAHIEPPRVLISKTATTSVWTFGTFRRAYLAFSEAMARELRRLLQGNGAQVARARAILLHELAHLQHNDVWLASLARSVLVVTIVFMALNLIVHWLTPLLYYGFIRFYDFTQPPWSQLIPLMERDTPNIREMLDPNNPIVAARWVDYRIAIFSSFMPLIVGSVLLLIFFWRALLRTRELYADARVVEWQNGDAEPLWEGLTVASTVESIQPKRRNWRDRIGGWLSGLRLMETERGGRWRTWLTSHPHSEQRRATLDAPYKIYGDDLSIALVSGAAVVLLNFNLLSLFYSANLRGPNSVPAFALGFTVISLSLLPFLCQYEGALRTLFGKVRKIVFIFTGIKLIPQLFGAFLLTYVAFVEPSFLQRGLEVSVRADLPSGFANELLGLFLENFVIRPAILFALFMPAFLIGYVFLDLWVKCKMLYWFGFEFLARHSAFVFAYSTAILALVLIFVILPIVDWITIPTAHDPLEPSVLAPIILFTIIGIIHFIMFQVLDQKYARICPHCKRHVASDYKLGLRCEHCGTSLNSWLVANHALAESSK